MREITERDVREPRNDIIRRYYDRLPSDELARRLGMSVKALYRTAFYYRIRKLERYRNPAAERFIREKHALGWTDAEIARELKWERKTVGDRRRQLGLASNALSEHRIDAIRAKTLEQCRQAGVANLGALRVKVLRERSMKMGWPADLPWRAAQILSVIWERGPMTRKEIVAAIRPDLAGRLDRHVMNAALNDNDVAHGRRHPNSYLATLARRGLLITVGRVRTGKRGVHPRLYSLPLTIERRQPGEEVADGAGKARG